ncbi:MAG: hypothetical protein VX986_05195 [Pseudomonadota bacterium]|nr:hypothetical protein [Pseudomonadota bacterium]
MASSFDLSKITSDNCRQLIEEFKKNPVGHHSPPLQKLLNIMRGAPMTNKYCLIVDEPNREWTLAKTTGKPGEAVKPTKRRFKNLEDAEWFVFKERWKSLTGEKLRI